MLVRRAVVGAGAGAVRAAVRARSGLPRAVSQRQPLNVQHGAPWGQFRRGAASMQGEEMKPAAGDRDSTPAPPDYAPVEIPSNLKIYDERVLSSKEKEEREFEYVVKEGPKYVPLFRLTEELSLEPAGEAEVNDQVFGWPVRKDIMHRVVTWQRAKWRQGTAKVKTRAERHGSNRKPHPQKGTGRARQGSRKAPHMRGGGRVHGPTTERVWAFKLPKKIRRYGLRSALTARHVEQNVFMIESFTPPGAAGPTEADGDKGQVKTRDIARMVKEQGWTGRVLFVDANPDTGGNLWWRKATNNLEKVKTLPSVGCNVYDVLLATTIVLSRGAHEELERRLDERLRPKPRY